MTTNHGLTFRDAFQQVCEQDFPEHIAELIKQLPAAEMNFNDGQIRLMEKLFRRFFEETQAPWPRYENLIAEQPKSSDEFDDEDEDEDSAPDHDEMGKLLAHRIMAIYYANQRLVQLIDTADLRPQWKLITVTSECPHAESFAQNGPSLHFQSPFWQECKLPCERADCGCRIAAE